MQKVLILFFVVSAASFGQSAAKKIVPINKSANIDFIKSEGGGVERVKPQQQPAPNVKPQPTPALKPQTQPSIQSNPGKPAVVTPQKGAVAPQNSPVIGKHPTYPAPSKASNSTPGPGPVRQLVTYYDSQGKASPIRPYSYSQAVKQG